MSVKARALAAAAVCAAALGCSSAQRAAPKPSSAPGSTSNTTSTATPVPSSTSNTTSTSISNTSSPPGAPSTAAQLAAAEAAWAHRDDPAALDEAVRLWEAAALRLAAPADALTAAARARRLRLERAAWSAQDALESVSRDATACADDARRAWSALFPEAAAAVSAGRPLAEALASIGPQGAEAVYLEAVCAGAWARAQGFTPLVERREELREMFSRVGQLAPQLDDAGAERELGKLFAALPAYAGGDLREARNHLDNAVARAPRAARNHLVYARTVAVKAQDRALFESQLQAALDAGDPAAAAEARELLSREDELFGPAEAAQPIPGGPSR